MLITWEGDGEEKWKEARERLDDVKKFSEGLLNEGRERDENDTAYGNYGEIFQWWSCLVTDEFSCRGRRTHHYWISRDVFRWELSKITAD